MTCTHLDRQAIEKLFRVRQRRARQIMAGQDHAQLRIRNPLNPWKSPVFDVTRVRLLTQAIAAICPSTNGGVLPAALSRARSIACQSAARWVIFQHWKASQHHILDIALDCFSLS